MSAIPSIPSLTPAGAAPRRWPAFATWAIAWLAMAVLDGRLDVANLALILVLAAALAALWLPPLASTVANAAAVLAFNFAFVPPRGVLDVELRQHALLLATMLAVSTIIALLVARQRRLAATERELAARAGRLRTFGDALRDADDPADCAPRLRELLAATSGASGALRWRDTAGAAPIGRLGEATPDEEDGLLATIGASRPLGAGTGRRAELRASWLPMRGRDAAQGAALVRWAGAGPVDAGLVEHLQALCDAMGLALERAHALRAAARAREASQAQALRGTLLAAIAHDHRTPLATILGAASALHDQDGRLDEARRRRLSATIVDEATQLARLTENTLQLVRLDAPGVSLKTDWESPEELIGIAVARVRRRDPRHGVRTAVEPGLPLLRCDAVLIVQMLDNLLNNALVHGDGDEPVEVAASRDGDRVRIAVRDRGPGVRAARCAAPADPARCDGVARVRRARAVRAGAGIGLAVCRAIARVHGGELVERDRPGGGASVECVLPVVTLPADARPAPEGGGA